ncbi:MAG: pantoate--beta-alanine ligase [Alphaproteobacteria bacterium]|nr:pantoate--beta-alanine ligase [Alphaproteobacteria bacterium]
MSLETIRRVRDLRERVALWRREGLRVGLVPTMGALHAGHLSLVEKALSLSDRVVATIFVNPRQFGPAEDLAAYPRREADDAALLDAAGAHLLFAPPVDEVYPEGFATTVTVTGVSEGLCGAVRPGHFAGVATVVTKLLLQSLPDVAVFGEKDWQQLQVIRRLVRDLDIPVTVEGAPTLREPDGLAMSSRNAYLGPEDRARAPRLYAILSQVASDLAAGADVATRTAWAVAELEKAGFGPVDYVEARDAETLAPVGERVTRPARLLAAARLGRARLIDNVGIAL